MENKKLKRQIRTRSKIRGTKNRPRLSVYKSNRFIYAQIIDDGKGTTLLGVSEKDLEEIKGKNKSERAKSFGELVAKKAINKKIKKIVFDRGQYSYRGRVKAIAEGARKGGLEF